MTWDESDRGLNAASAEKRSLGGSPPVAVSRLGEGQLRISMGILRPGEDSIMAERVKALFS